jgi:hypothetical protein
VFQRRQPDFDNNVKRNSFLPKVSKVLLSSSGGKKLHRIVDAVKVGLSQS